MGKASKVVVITFSVIMILFFLYQYSIGNAFNDAVNPAWVFASAVLLGLIAITALFLEKKRRGI